MKPRMAEFVVLKRHLKAVLQESYKEHPTMRKLLHEFFKPRHKQGDAWHLWHFSDRAVATIWTVTDACPHDAPLGDAYDSDAYPPHAYHMQVFGVTRVCMPGAPLSGIVTVLKPLFAPGLTDVPRAIGKRADPTTILRCGSLRDICAWCELFMYTHKDVMVECMPTDPAVLKHWDTAHKHISEKVARMYPDFPPPVPVIDRVNG